MLPDDLHGPGLTISFASKAAVVFLRDNSARYPQLDPAFISQICFEHPDRFDVLLPGFDVSVHAAVRVSKPAAWITDNVRWEDGSVVDFWCDRFTHLLAADDQRDEIFSAMRATGSWPFPPVIIAAACARRIGALPSIGRPYCLIEGTHRLSYLRSMLRLGLIAPARELDVIEIVAR